MHDTKLATILVLMFHLLLAGLLLIISANAQEQQRDWLTAQSEPCQRLKIVSRQEWGAKRSLERLDSFESSAGDSATGATLPNRVFIHQAWDGRSCADIDSCTIRLQAIQAYHQYSKGWPDISYNFLISADGTVYEGLGFTLVGFHTLDYNYDSLGVAFIGTFQDIYPTQQMERALQDLLSCAVDSNYLSRDYMLHGHRDARCTICPGNAAYGRISLMSHFRPGPLARYSCPKPRAPNSELQTLMIMQNNQQRQLQSPPATTVQVLNINSNNNLMAAAITRDEKFALMKKEEANKEAAIGGVIQRQREAPVRESHSERSSFRDEPEHDDGNARVPDTKAPLKMGSKDTKVILVNLQPQQASDSQQQPALYLFTTKSISKTSPVLLISPVANSAGSRSPSAGLSPERETISPNEPSRGTNPSGGGTGEGSTGEENNQRGPSRGNNSPTRRPINALNRPSQGSSGGDGRGSGSVNSNNRSPPNQSNGNDEGQIAGGGGGGEVERD